MTIARHYRMTAKPGGGEPLRGAVIDLVAALGSVPGFEGAELMRDVAAEDQFVFIERWGSVQLHKDGGALLPKTALASLMDALVEWPKGAYLEYLPTA